MTSDVNDEEGPEIQDGTRQRYANLSRDSARKRRSLQAILRRQWRTLTKPRNALRVAAVAFPLFGFVIVSFANGVLMPGSDAETRRVAAKPDVWSPVALQASVSATGDAPAASQRTLASVFENPATGSTKPVAASLDVQVPAGSSRNTIRAAGLDAAGKDADPVESYTERLHAALSDGVEQAEAAGAGARTYPVNEGGSLWRAGRKFLADDVVLDRLIDNLRASGMNVRRVFPGAEFQVDTVSDGHLVVRIDHGRDSYVSSIIDGKVSTTVRRPVAVAIESSFATDAAAGGLDDSAIAEILARDEDVSLGVDNARPGDSFRFELRETRNFGSATKTTDIVWIEKNGERLWRETSNVDTRTVAWIE